MVCLVVCSGVIVTATDEEDKAKNIKIQMLTHFPEWGWKRWAQGCKTNRTTDHKQILCWLRLAHVGEVVYDAKVTTTEDPTGKNYIGVTEGPDTTPTARNFQTLSGNSRTFKFRELRRSGEGLH